MNYKKTVTTISVDREVWSEAKKILDSRGQKISNLIERKLIEFLKEEENVSKKKERS